MDGVQLFGALEPATEAALRASIECFGVLVPVTFDQRGRMIDGHHRWRIASELRIDCPWGVRHVADDDEAAELARTLNMDRRHLDPALRRTVAAALRRDGHNLRAIAAAASVCWSSSAILVWRRPGLRPGALRAVGAHRAAASAKTPTGSPLRRVAGAAFTAHEQGFLRLLA